MGTREIRSRQDVAPLAIVTVVGVTATIAALHGVAHDLGTAGSLSSVLALPIMVAIFYAARLLHHRLRRARMATPRREDRRNRAHVITTINTCKSPALGAERPGSEQAMAMSAMRDIAFHIGAARAMHGHLLAKKGNRLAERAYAAARRAIAGQPCVSADLSHVIHALGHLEGEILDIDSDALVRRRAQEAGAEEPGPE
ncbi:MAG: hypothetical protein OXU86_00785 [Thaumarchaeota archaeon]|nr:hypothetical protein [Nitrososphaerota archaeon]MDD9825305.1 hypothetical protein [Nitrososphaerota archaeon]